MKHLCRGNFGFGRHWQTASFSALLWWICWDILAWLHRKKPSLIRCTVWENQLCRVMSVQKILPFNAKQPAICISVTASLHPPSECFGLEPAGLKAAQSSSAALPEEQRGAERRGVTGGGTKRKGCDVWCVSFQVSPTKPNLHHLRTGRRHCSRS